MFYGLEDDKISHKTKKNKDLYDYIIIYNINIDCLFRLLWGSRLLSDVQRRIRRTVMIEFITLITLCITAIIVVGKILK